MSASIANPAGGAPQFATDFFVLLKTYEEKVPQITFEWHDPETEAVGWVVINSLRNGSAGGGTRMSKEVDRREVESLAKTMEVKFTVAGPPIWGAKSGINFDPQDPRKEGVLRRWFKAVLPLLSHYYGTGGDMNVDEHLVIALTKEHDLPHPQAGTALGHFGPNGYDQRIAQLSRGVELPVTSPALALGAAGKFLVSDLITGYGVAESVRHYYDLWPGTSVAGKRVVVQGWGNVGGAAGYYLTQQGARIVGIIDHAGGLLNDDGFTLAEVTDLLLNRSGNALNPATPNFLPAAELHERVWQQGVDIFVPAAASRLVTQAQVEQLVAGGLEVIASGANVPFADPKEVIFFGPIADFADHHCASIPDFIANCGMARVFAYLMQPGAALTDEAIFADVSQIIYAALARTRALSPANTEIARRSFEVALRQLV